MGPNMFVIFVRYSREFATTVIVITEFDCTLHYFPESLPSKATNIRLSTS